MKKANYLLKISKVTVPSVPSNRYAHSLPKLFLSECGISENSVVEC